MIKQKKIVTLDNTIIKFRRRLYDVNRLIGELIDELIGELGESIVRQVNKEDNHISGL
jgi:hypothetical protein